MTKAKDRLDELIAEKEKLENDYAELQKANTVSILHTCHKPVMGTT